MFYHYALGYASFFHVLEAHICRGVKKDEEKKHAQNENMGPEHNYYSFG